MNFKKIIFTAAILLALGSGAFAKAKNTKNDSNKLKIVATIFPQYDWTREILGENAGGTELTLLVGNGVDLHSYQPSIQDIAKISTADIFIYTGGESDGWVKDALKNARNKNMKVINLLEVLGDSVKEEEIKEGMQAEEEEEAESEDEEEIEYDEHVWLSVKNTKVLSRAICDTICEKDPINESAYLSNLKAYLARLDALDEKYASAVKAGSKKTLLFGDRFPFRYLTEDYNLDYFAAFAGCSAETEASFETVIFLARKLDQLGLNAVLTIENSDGKIARTIVQNSKNKGAKVLSLDSMQSVTGTQIKGGRSYISLMEKNLEVIKEAIK